MNEYFCPLCKVALVAQEGDGINPKNGIFLYCANRACPAQEVAGHGKNIKDAYEIVLAKFVKKKN